jgi:hypothetical protein
MKNERYPLVILLALLLTGCGASVQESAISPAARSASPLLTQCPSGSAGRMECLETALLDTLAVEGIAAAMNTLERIGAVDEEIRRDGHVYAHVIGLAAYTGPDDVGRAFAECTPSFQSGCYHGVIQSYFVDLAGSGSAAAVGEAQVNGLCEAYRGDPGLGTGCSSSARTAWVTGSRWWRNTISRARWPRAIFSRARGSGTRVYGGAVHGEHRERDVAPHHTTGRPDQGGDHGARSTEGTRRSGASPAWSASRRNRRRPPSHDGPFAACGLTRSTPVMASPRRGTPAEPWPALDPDDLHHPCSALAERYQPSCYMMQTSVVLHQTNGDFAAAARMCDETPESLRSTCYISLGRDVSAYVVQDHRQALRRCEIGAVDQRPWCHVGYVKNVIDVTARADEGIAYCRMLPRGAAKEHCYRAVGHQIAVLSGDPARRAEMCTGAEAEHRATCLAAAGVEEPHAGAGLSR